jgi:uncharacterized protein YecE (DUF72 family)
VAGITSPGAKRSIVCKNPEVFAKWHDATPDKFIFSVKAPRFIGQRNELRSVGTALERFLASGLTELKSKLGPILWQLADSKKFDAEEIDGFLNREFLQIARQHGVAVVYEDDAVRPGFADLTTNFVYARLRRSTASCATGYPLAALNQWALRARTWAKGKEPTDLPRLPPRS